MPPQVNVRYRSQSVCQQRLIQCLKDRLRRIDQCPIDIEQDCVHATSVSRRIVVDVAVGETGNALGLSGVSLVEVCLLSTRTGGSIDDD